MKRKIFATVMALVLCTATLVGCGSSADSSAQDSYKEPTASPEVVVKETEEAPTASPEPSNDVEADIQEDTNELTEDKTEQVLEEESVPVEEESIEEEVVVKAGEIEGIIVLQNDYKSNTYAPSFVISAINPQTGDYHEVSSFVFEHVARIQESEFLIEPAYKNTCYNNYRGLFNDDFTLMAANKTFLNDESEHAGWIDQSGEFFDLTIALNEQAQSDFDDLKHYEAVGFTDDNTFIYAEMTDRRHPLYRAVSLDNLTPGASYEITEDDPCIMGINSGAWRWLNGSSKTCWINDDQFLTVGFSGEAMICVRATISSQTMEQIVSTGSQTSWSPVLGSDGSSVAFMSAPAKGAENPSIYITNLDGSITPTKLETSYSPLCGRVGGGGNVLYTISPAYYYTSILEWR